MLVEKLERVLKTSGIGHIQSTRLVFLEERTQNLKWKLACGLCEDLWVMVVTSVQQHPFSSVPGMWEENSSSPLKLVRTMWIPMAPLSKPPFTPNPTPTGIWRSHTSGAAQTEVPICGGQPPRKDIRPRQTLHSQEQATAGLSGGDLGTIWYTSITCLILTEILSKGRYLTSLPFTGTLKRKPADWWL